MSLNSKSRAENRRGRWAEPYTRPDTSLLGDLSVPLFEPVHATRRIDKTLLAGVERVAHRTDIEVDVFHAAFGLELMTTGAHDRRRIIVGMNALLHCPAPGTDGNGPEALSRLGPVGWEGGPD